MPRPRSNIAPRILKAARAHFLKRGVDGASLRAIASAARTNIGMVYYYFPTKDDLFVAVVESVYATLLADLSALLDRPGPLPEKLRGLYARIWKMSDDEYTTVRLIMRETMVSAARVKRLSGIFQRGHVPLLLGAIVGGTSEGTLREDLPPIAQLVSTMALGLLPMLVWRVAGEKVLPDLPLPPPEELGALFTSVLLEGLGAKKPRPRRS